MSCGLPIVTRQSELQDARARAMESYSSLDPAPGAAGEEPVAQAKAELNPEDGVQQGSANRTSQASVSAALAAARAGSHEQIGSAARFPGEDAGHSLAAMAQRDLDAALQLLADRAQYITGANGAAIALRRSGKNDMQCRASSGSNAPELGALLSTEFGLSGESVRTRQALRCDDAERDARVNREVCRQLGIASVVVMPVVNDDEVLGVFELFSGKANAFGERDLSALQRLSEMVETAVRLARVTENLPERLKRRGVATEVLKDNTPVVAVRVAAVKVVGAEAKAGGDVDDDILEGDVETEVVHEASGAKVAAAVSAPAPAPQIVQEVAHPERTLQPAAQRKPLLWSAESSAADVQESAQPDQSQVPPGLRHLKKCVACGFPVSEARLLCVECEEKKWRGQLRSTKPVSQQAASAVSTTPPAARTFAAAAPASSSSAAAAAAVAPKREPAPGAPPSPDPHPSTSSGQTFSQKAREMGRASDVKANESKDLTGPPLPLTAAITRPIAVANSETAARLVAETSRAAPRTAPQTAPAELVLSAGLAPSQSWFSANKYIVGALLVVAAIVAGILLLR